MFFFAFVFVFVFVFGDRAGEGAMLNVGILSCSVFCPVFGPLFLFPGSFKIKRISKIGLGREEG